MKRYKVIFHGSITVYVDAESEEEAEELAENYIKDNDFETSYTEIEDVYDD